MKIEKTQPEKNMIIFKLPEKENINRNLPSCVMEIITTTEIQITEWCIVDTFRLENIRKAETELFS